MTETNEINTSSSRQKWATSALVAVAIVALLAAGFRPKGDDTVTVVERTFDDIDAASILEGYEGSDLSEEVVMQTAAYRAMCQRTMTALQSAQADRGPANQALERMAPQARERLEQPARVARNMKDENMARVFELLSESMARGEVAPAADFVANSCDTAGAYLDRSGKADIQALAEDGAFADLISNVTDRPVEDAEDGPAEPEE
jgi:hypothetical protein